MELEQKPILSTLIITKLEDLIRQVRDTLFHTAKHDVDADEARKKWDEDTNKMIEDCYK